MKYHIATWSRGARKWMTVSPLELEQLKPLALEGDRNDRAHHAVLATIHYTDANYEEMRQHARKLAAYFEQVDIAKEAVINCTKL